MFWYVEYALWWRISSELFLFLYIVLLVSKLTTIVGVGNLEGFIYFEEDKNWDIVQKKEKLAYYPKIEKVLSNIINKRIKTSLVDINNPD